MGIKIENQYGPGELADDIFVSFLRANANAAIAMKEDEKQYFANLSSLIANSRAYSGTPIDNTPGSMTDWEYAEYELGEAASIYCNGSMDNCYDDAMGEPQGQLVGILNTAFQQHRNIWQNSQEWIEKFAGDGGWMDSVENLQKSAGGKEATQGANELLTNIAEFHKAKDGAFRDNVITETQKAMKALSESINLSATLGMFDMTPGDPELNYMQPPFSQPVLDLYGYDPQLVDKNTNPLGLADLAGFEEYLTEYAKEAQLTIAVEKFKIGDVEGSKAAHTSYLRGIDERRNAHLAMLAAEEEQRVADVAQRVEEKNEAMIKYDEDVDTELGMLQVLQLNITGDTGLKYDIDFKKSLQSKLEGPSFAKGALNMDTLPSFKRPLARNLAEWMNEFSRGDTNVEWKDAVKNIEELFPKLAREDVMVKAVDAFFGVRTAEDIGTMVHGSVLPAFPFGLGGTGIDFPGTFGKEEKAQEYMLQTFKVWDLLNNMQNDPMLKVDIGTGGNIDPQDPLSAITLNKGQYINTMPQDSSTNLVVPPVRIDPLDTLLLQLTDTTTFQGVYDPGDDKQSTLMRLMETYKDWGQVQAIVDTTVAALAKDSTIANPDAEWPNYVNNFLDQKHLYPEGIGKYMDFASDTLDVGE